MMTMRWIMKTVCNVHSMPIEVILIYIVLYIPRSGGASVKRMNCKVDIEDDIGVEDDIDFASHSQVSLTSVDGSVESVENTQPQ